MQYINISTDNVLCFTFVFNLIYTTIYIIHLYSYNCIIYNCKRHLHLLSYIQFMIHIYCNTFIYTNAVTYSRHDFCT